MYLKKIHVNGFKSFADKTTLTFERKAISGVVGPNGSGKSNIIDAVRWVMGEQNAKMLRGEQATDIIFSGSEKRKPVAMAEVSLVFDNSENSPFCPSEYRHEPEIQLTRRIYLDGTREYMLNKKPCRLKDIVDFFALSGLGGKSYSMIQQGQVDRILHAKPEEIREIFEEAAGTFIFKKRKEEALGRVDETSVSLSRLNDLFEELSRQKTSLEEQVHRAKSFEQYQAALTELEKTFFLSQYQKSQEEAAQARDSMGSLTGQESGLLAHIQKLSREYENFENRLEAEDPELRFMGEEVVSLREKIASREGILQGLLESQKVNQKNWEEKELRYQEDLSDWEEIQKKTLEDESACQKREEKLEKLYIQREEIEEDWERLTEEKQVYESKIENFKIEKNKLEILEQKTSHRLEHLSNLKSERLASRHQRYEKVQTWEEEKSKVSILEEGLSFKVQQGEKNLSKLYVTKRDLDKSLESHREDLAKLEKIKEAIQSQFWQIKARWETGESSLLSSDLGEGHDKAMADEVFPSGVFLAHKIRWKDGTVPLPLETQKSVEKWCERWLISDELQWRAVLGTKTSGRALYVPAYEDSSLKEIGMFAQRWGLSSLGNYLVGETWAFWEAFLYGDFHDRWEILWQMPRGCVLFGPFGDVYEGPQSLEWGDKGPTQMAQKQNQRDLRENWEKLETELKEVQEEIQSLKDKIKHRQSELQELQGPMARLSQEQLKAMGDLQKAQQERIWLEEKISSRKLENQEDADLQKWEEELSHLESQAEIFHENMKNLSMDEEEIYEVWESLAEKIRIVSSQRDRIKWEIMELETHKKNAQIRHEEEEKRRNQYGERARKYANDQAEWREKQLILGTRILEIETELETLILERQALEDILLEKREKQAGTVAAMKELEEALGALKQRRSSCHEELEAQRRLLEKALSSIETLENLAHQQEKDNFLKDSSFEIPRDFEPTVWQKKMVEIREEIHKLGPVNMAALDEYKVLEERWKFLEQQKDEVLAALEVLNTAIAEIEDHARQRFLDVFYKLNGEFQELFPILFPGGEAELVLEDAENPLNTGVEILVRLPGKNRQNMRLFSGGERALTAIALIFALLKSKPTPFCFLDEVDAALDEGNVVRYNRVLETLSHRFQFIVITHRRRTMEILDILYGVTMQEPGVSKIVSVDMEKSLPSHLKKSPLSDGNRSIMGATSV